MVDAGLHLEVLYRRHAGELLQYLRARSGNAAEAEDLLHETFVQAAQFSDRLTAAASPRAWLFGVAGNVAGGIRRRLTRRRMNSIPTDAAAPAQTEDPRLDAMRVAIGRLEDPLRETLELRLRQDLSYAEVAEVLAIPVGT